MINFPELEKKVLKFWQDNNIFKKSLKKNERGTRFVFFEGPPTANGRPGVHHVLARAFKDVIPRFKTMQGYLVERKAGWDTHGLPVELEVEKELEISGKGDIEKYGLEKFNKKCQSNVWKYKKDWEEMTRRLGFWIDLEDPYVTYDNNYIESVWWILKQVWDKKLLYQGHKVVPHCPRCGTALSSHEVAQGYKNIEEESVYIKFELEEEKNTYVLAWTTTPWTLPGNVALALGEDVEYVKVKMNDEFLILAKARLDILEGNYQIVENYKGKDLAGKKYKPLFDFLNLEKETGKKAYILALANFVTTEDGTGIVHTAGMYGEDDYILSEKIGLPKVHTVDENGEFNKLVKPWAGRFVKEEKLEKEILDYLKDKNLLFKTEKYKHDYPFCWRCDSPLLYYAKNSWFIKMSALRDQLKQNNQQINWIPDYIKEGRFGEWINEVKDWAISRERYWGTPLPIWQCEKCKKYQCLGSREELNSYQGDLHRPYVDEIELDCECGGKMKRVQDVIDCWFDSGSMPFSQWHYPFENKEKIDQGLSYPADFISEAMDQTRGWFYTLLAISTLLGKGTSYKNVICLGLVLDKNGQKMSKSKGNIVKPDDIFEKYGADAARWYFYTLNQPGETKLFDMKGVEEVVKKVFLILMNVHSFYQMYAESKIPEKIKSDHVLDQWINSKINLLIEKVTQDLESFDPTKAARRIADFINDLSTWYLRRSRDRFKTGEKKDKERALATLYLVLFKLSKLMAPFTPFLAEELYKKLKGEKESVHLEDWPKAEPEKYDQVLYNMEKVQQLVELGHALRAENAIKVRQPLAQILSNINDLPEDYKEIIKKELNLHEVHLDKKEIKENIDFKIKEAGEIKVALDITITDQLKEEGLVREVIRHINSLRKKAKLTIGDKVELSYYTEEEKIKKIFENYKEEIKKETASKDLRLVIKEEAENLSKTKSFKLDHQEVIISIK
ncbi:MAG: isoleucine--tRNA ligase [Patescibacteria group bacterium]|nr:isoleucine--tRNA ligase [Patescibacteria group bacterium]